MIVCEGGNGYASWQLHGSLSSLGTDRAREFSQVRGLGFDKACQLIVIAAAIRGLGAESEVLWNIIKRIERETERAA